MPASPSAPLGRRSEPRAAAARAANAGAAHPAPDCGRHGPPAPTLAGRRFASTAGVYGAAARPQSGGDDYDTETPRSDGGADMPLSAPRFEAAAVSRHGDALDQVRLHVQASRRRNEALLHDLEGKQAALRRAAQNMLENGAIAPAKAAPTQRRGRRSAPNGAALQNGDVLSGSWVAEAWDHHVSTSDPTQSTRYSGAVPRRAARGALRKEARRLRDADDARYGAVFWGPTEPPRDAGNDADEAQDVSMLFWGAPGPVVAEAAVATKAPPPPEEPPPPPGAAPAAQVPEAARLPEWLTSPASLLRSDAASPQDTAAVAAVLAPAGALRLRADAALRAAAALDAVAETSRRSYPAMVLRHEALRCRLLSAELGVAEACAVNAAARLSDAVAVRGAQELLAKTRAVVADAQSGANAARLRAAEDVESALQARMKCSEAIRLRENEAIAARVVAKRLAAADASAAEDVLYRAASLQRFGVKVARRVRSRLRRRKHRRALEAAEKRRVRDGAATKVQACLRGKLNWRAPLPGPEPTVVAEAPAAAPCAESALVRSFSLGDAVLARWENDDLWYPAVVDKVHADLTYDVTFDDGDFRIKAPYTDVAPSDANDRAVSTREALAVLGEDDDEGGGLVIRRDASDNAWEEAVDDLGRVYFWNTRTGEASWVRPNTMTIQSRRASRPPTPRNVASEELRFDESGSYRYVGYEDTVPTNADGY